MPGLMYFGNKERMTWVKCPDSGMGMTGSRWTAEGIFLNGGSFVRSSVSGHRAFDLAWNFLRADEKDEIRAYLDGVYGSGLLYFLDPFALRRNVLSTAWASPSVASEGGTALLYNMGVIPPAVASTSTLPGAPTKGVLYTLLTGAQFKEQWIPVPAGHQMHLSSKYSGTGTGALTVTVDGGSAVTVPNDGTPLLLSGSGYTLKLSGIGTVTLEYNMAQVLPTGTAPDFSRFYPGIGHSGARLTGDISDVGYSSPQALDFSALSFTLRETGSWE